MLPINPAGDDRVKHCHADLNGRHYHYLLAQPTSGSFRATLFLIHGWPDLSMGWRYQIPFLVNLGLRVVAPDMMGYGGTDAPKVASDDLGLYSHKRAADDVKELARQLGASSIIIGGHDWGGSIVYRCALWHPDLISHVFSVCTPYVPPNKAYLSLEDTIKRAPQFGYQAHLAGPEVEATITSKQQIRSFLNGMYGGRGPNRESLFSPTNGIDFSVLDKIGRAPLMPDEIMDYYVEEYARHGLHGPLNWYRTRRVNYEEELSLPTPKLTQPVLFITATKDNVLLPSMSGGMEHSIPNLTRGDVDAGHWALWQRAEEVNVLLGRWFEGVVFGGKSKL